MDNTETVLKRIFGVIARGQTYLNLVYVFLAFPLGLFYFVFLVTGLSVGIGTVIIWIGLLILMLMLGAWWLFILFERQLAIGLLQVKMDPIETPKTKEANSFWKKIGAYLSNPTTWKGLLYLFLKFPLGTVYFCVLVAFVAVTLSFLGAPFYYSFVHPEVYLAPTYYWTVDTLGKAMALFVAGIPMVFITLHLVNGMAWISAWMSKVLLGNPAPKAVVGTPIQAVTVEPSSTAAVTTEGNAEG